MTGWQNNPRLLNGLIAGQRAAGDRGGAVGAQPERAGLRVQAIDHRTDHRARVAARCRCARGARCAAPRAAAVAARRRRAAVAAAGISAGADRVSARAHRLHRGFHPRASLSGAARGADELDALAASAILALLWPSIPPALRVPSGRATCWPSPRCRRRRPWWRLASQGDDRRRRLSADARRRAVHDVRSRCWRPTSSHSRCRLATLWILGTYWAAQWCIASWLKPAPARCVARG